KFWEHFQLDTLDTNFYDVDQPLAWSIAVGIFARAYADQNEGQIILHAHEWLTGGAILAIAAEGGHERIRTVFTTHATVLGRALSSQSVFIYDRLDQIQPSEEA